MNDTTKWEFLHPNTNLQHLGFIPFIFTEKDPRPAKDQANDRYAHGGGWNPLERWTLDTATLIARYPGDPETKPIAKLQLHDETIVVYPDAWVAIIQPDGSYEVSRMD